MIQRPKRQNLHRAIHDASTTPHTLNIVHRDPTAGIPHNVNSHVTHLRADIARDTALLVRHNAIARKAGIDMHQRGKRAPVSTPNATAVEEIDAKPEHAGKHNIYQQFIPVPQRARHYRNRQSRVNLMTQLVWNIEEPAPDGCPKDHLTQVVHSFRPRAMWSQRAILISQRLGHRPAGTDPTAIRALSPEIDKQEQNTEGLNKWKPRPECTVTKLVDIERPEQNECKRTPFSRWKELLA